MDNQIVKISDPQKTVGKVIGYGLIAAIIGAVGYYIVPRINEIIENYLYLGVLAAAALLMWFVFTSKKFWLGIELLGTFIGRYTLGLVIDLDPWNVLYAKVEDAEKQREKLMIQINLLRGQEAKLKEQIFNNNKIMRESQQALKILDNSLAANPNDDDALANKEIISNDFVMAKQFIDNVQPIYNDIEKLVTFAEKAYNKSGTEIKVARNTIKQQRALYDAVTTGSNAMNRAMRAFTGREDLNQAADLALDKLRTDIGNKIGNIKTSIKVTSQFMNEKDLKDAAKVADAVETMKQLSSDSSVPYSNSVTASKVGVGNTSSNNKYMDFLDK